MEMFFKKFRPTDTGVETKKKAIRVRKTNMNRNEKTKAEAKEIYLTYRQTPFRYWLIDILNLAQQLKFLLHISHDDTTETHTKPHAVKLYGKDARRQTNKYSKTISV